MDKPGRHSSQRVAQSAWIVLSVYLGLVLGDLVQNGLYPAIFTESSKRHVLVLMIFTLLFLLLNIIESYVWLNPKEKLVSGKEAIFKMIHVFIVIAYTICIAFLTLALTDGDYDPNTRMWNWTISFVFILILFSLYNFLWLLKPKFVSSEVSEDDKDIKLAPRHAGFYLLWAAVFTTHILVFKNQSNKLQYYTLSGLFSIYLVVYFIYWWPKWHSKMFNIDGENHSGVIRITNREDNDLANHSSRS